MECLVMNYSDEDDVTIIEPPDKFTVPIPEDASVQISGNPCEKILEEFDSFLMAASLPSPVTFQDSSNNYIEDEDRVVILSDEDGSVSDDVISSIVISNVETIVEEHPDVNTSSPSDVTISQSSVVPDERSEIGETQTNHDRGEERSESSLSNKENSTGNIDKPVVKSKGENSEKPKPEFKPSGDKQQPKLILFKCEHCSYSATIRFALKRHLLIHSENVASSSKFKCAHCSYECESKKALTIHSIRVHRDHNSRCTKCGRLVPLQTKKDHFLRCKEKLGDRKKKLYKCDYCSYKTNGETSLRLHIRLHTVYNRPIYRCSKCDFRSTKINYTRHLKVAHIENLSNELKKNKNYGAKKMYRCRKCDYKAPKKMLFHHIKTVHKKSEVLHQVPSKRNLSENKTDNTVDKSISIYNCDYCSHSTTVQGNLLKHLRLHSIYNRPIYRCSKCDYKSTKANYAKHLKIAHQQNSSGKLKNCKFCSSEHCMCTNVNIKAEHEIIREASGRRSSPESKSNTRHSCEFCSFTTKTEFELNKHLLSHPEHKVQGKHFKSMKSRITYGSNQLHKCKLCSYSTQIFCNLKRHISYHNERNLTIHKCNLCDYKGFKLTVEKHSKTSHKCIYKNMKETLNKPLIKANTNKGCSKVYGRQFKNTKPELFYCDRCPFTTKYRRALSDHQIKCLYRSTKPSANDPEWKPTVGIKSKQANRCTRQPRVDIKKQVRACEFCSYITQHEHCLRKHRRLHTVGKKAIFSCSKCSFKAPAITLSHHYKKTHGVTLADIKPKKKANTCEFCSYTTQHEHCLRYHRRLHTVGKKAILNCSECSFKAPAIALSHHYKKTHGVTLADIKSKRGVRTCEFCSFTTKHKHSLRSHRRLHTDFKRPILNCPECSYKAPQITLIYHYKTTHGRALKPVLDDLEETVQKEAKQSCKLCSYTTNYYSEFYSHLQMHKGNETIYSCSWCSYKSFKHNVKEHEQMIHKEIFIEEKPSYVPGGVERPPKTKQENRQQSPNKTELVQIVQTLYNQNVCNQVTTNSVVYMCEFCEYNTTDKATLINHKLLHSQTNNVTNIKQERAANNKVFLCTDCKRHFSTRFRFKRHICEYSTDHYTVQTKGESLTFKCTNCVFQTESKTNIKRHCKDVHGAITFETLK